MKKINSHLTRKRLSSLMLALALATGLAFGPGAAIGEAAPAATAAVMQNAETGVTLDRVAALNGCTVDDLNVVRDEQGYISFIGNQLSEDKIADGQAAADFLYNKLADLLDLNGIDLVLYSDYTSPNTGVTYYRFQQVLKTDLDLKTHNGRETLKEVPGEFLVNGLKLGVNAEGYPVVISSDLTHANMKFDPHSIISMKEAEAIVARTNPDAHIYTDYTDFTMWQDQSASSAGTTSGEVLLVYLVYADNSTLSGNDSGDGNNADGKAKAGAADNTAAAAMPDKLVNEKPYICYVVSAVSTKKTGGDPIVAALATDSLGNFANSETNTTLSYFNNMKDVGEYSYQVDFSWMNESDRQAAKKYTGANSINVTVPVMYCEADGLYYLGQKQHHIMMSNYVDAFINNGNTNKLNPYVTDDPTKLSSWHFKFDSNEQFGWKYQDNPNYVIASFAEYVKIINAFGNKFNMFEAYPKDSYLLETYTIDIQYLMQMIMNGAPYPDDVAGFEYNASNGGQYYDWSTFNTSPNLALCLDDTVMSHEFTHGVNSHFATAKYANEQGAVMESLADMVGYQMASGLDSSLKGWLCGGTYGIVFRDMGNPVSKFNPEYKGGVYYVNHTPEAIINGGLTDCGGVHTNSGVPNYLGYLLVNGKTADDEAAITTEEGLKLWFETLYLCTFDTDFVDIGAYLKYAAAKLGYSTAQQNYIGRTVQRLGFKDGKVDQELLDAEQYRGINVHIDSSKELGKEYYFTIQARSDDGTGLTSGGFVNNTDQVIKLAKDKSFATLTLFAQSDKQARTYDFFAGVMDFADVKDDMIFHVKKVDVKSGDKLVLAAGESPLYNRPFNPYVIFTDADTGNVAFASDNAVQGIIFTKSAGAADGEYNAYLITFLNAE